MLLNNTKQTFILSATSVVVFPALALRPDRLRQTHSYRRLRHLCQRSYIMVAATMSRTESTHRCAWKAASPTLAIALTTRSAIAR